MRGGGQQRELPSQIAKGRPRTAASAPKKKTPENDEEQKKQEILKREMMRHVANEDGELPMIFHKNEIFLIFESELQAEIFNSRCNDSGEAISQEKAKVFKEEFNRINSKKAPTTLNLFSMRLGVNTIITLSNLLQNKRYETLNLADNAISDYGMHAVKSIITNTKIRSLNLASNMISEAGLEMIVDELSKSQKLRAIDLGVLEGSIRKNSIGVDGAKCLAAVILQNKVLESLRLQDNDIGLTGGEIIGTALKQNKTLKHLTLAENDLKTQGAEFILKSATSLESLDLGKNFIKPNVGPSLKEYLERNQNLRRLNLEYNELLALGVEYLALGLRSATHLQSLNIKGNGIRDEGLEILSRAIIDNPSLEELDVSLNEITPAGVAHLAEALVQSGLKSVNLSKNLLGDESLIVIADAAVAAGECVSLTRLDVGSSRISDAGVLHFLERLDAFTGLRVLRIPDNFISEKIEKILLEILEKNRTLIEFGLQGNRLSLCCMNRIRKILQRNNRELEEREPNKIRTEIYRLKYEQKKIMSVKEKLSNQEREINKLEDKKSKLSMDLDRLKLTEQSKRQNLQDKINEQYKMIERKKVLMKQKEEEFEKRKQEQEEQLAQLREQFARAASVKQELQQELEQISEELAAAELEHTQNLQNIEAQIEEQKKKKEEFEKKTLELNSEFAQLMKQERELQERKAKKKAEKENVNTKQEEAKQ